MSELCGISRPQIAPREKEARGHTDTQTRLTRLDTQVCDGPLFSHCFLQLFGPCQTGVDSTTLSCPHRPLGLLYPVSPEPWPQVPGWRGADAELPCDRR